jgi:hypothetical protein
MERIRRRDSSDWGMRTSTLLYSVLEDGGQHHCVRLIHVKVKDDAGCLISIGFLNLH